jgi:hypothetical protein
MHPASNDRRPFFFLGASFHRRAENNREALFSYYGWYAAEQRNDGIVPSS